MVENGEILYFSLIRCLDHVHHWTAFEKHNIWGDIAELSRDMTNNYNDGIGG